METSKRGSFSHAIWGHASTNLAFKISNMETCHQVLKCRSDFIRGYDRVLRRPGGPASTRARGPIRTCLCKLGKQTELEERSSGSALIQASSGYPPHQNRRICFTVVKCACMATINCGRRQIAISQRFGIREALPGMLNRRNRRVKMKDVACG